MAESTLNILALLGDTMRKKIITARCKSKLSIAELAERCGWSEDILLKMEQGEQEITPEAFAKILDAIKYFQD